MGSTPWSACVSCSPLRLGYDLPKGLGDYGLNVERLVELPRKNPYVVFLHGTTWDTKHWPEVYWRELTERVGYLGVGGEAAVGQRRWRRPGPNASQPASNTPKCCPN